MCLQDLQSELLSTVLSECLSELRPGLLSGLRPGLLRGPQLLHQPLSRLLFYTSRRQTTPQLAPLYSTLTETQLWPEPWDQVRRESFTAVVRGSSVALTFRLLYSLSLNLLVNLSLSFNFHLPFSLSPTLPNSGINVNPNPSHSHTRLGLNQHI